VLLQLKIPDVLIVNKFLVRGVAYQVVELGSSIDPITDDRLPRLERDVLLFKELGLNTLQTCKCNISDQQ
jgi:hypothetical protein